MIKTRIKRGKLELAFIIALLTTVFLIKIVFASIPSGPSLEYAGNETSVTSGVPTAEDNTSNKGGYIITLRLTARQPDSNYKAYVGNVTGSYVLEDASNYSIYEWSIATIGGEVYATRRSTSVSWGSVECANESHINDEMDDMHHNSSNTADDPMNETFDDDKNDHWGFWAGSTQITTDSCNYSINTYVNDTAQSATDWFDEVLLYDGSGDIIYVTKIEDNLPSYKTGVGENVTYDFQMLVAENGSPSTSQTDYYFYVELS